MSLAYHKLKLRATQTVVGRARDFCDGANIVLATFMLPFQRLGNRINAEAPWVVFVAACTLSMVIPLMAYPWVKPYITHDARAEREEERVRLCVQKGIDPYPYMSHKDSMHGNNIPAFGREREYPKSAAWEYELMEEYLQRKDELRAEVGAEADESVDRLLKMRAARKREYLALKGRVQTEPHNIVFQGRPDVDKLHS